VYLESRFHVLFTETSAFGIDLEIETESDFLSDTDLESMFAESFSTQCYLYLQRSIEVIGFGDLSTDPSDLNIVTATGSHPITRGLGNTWPNVLTRGLNSRVIFALKRISAPLPSYTSKTIRLNSLCEVLNLPS